MASGGQAPMPVGQNLHHSASDHLPEERLEVGVVVFVGARLRLRQKAME